MLFAATDRHTMNGYLRKSLLCGVPDVYLSCKTHLYPPKIPTQTNESTGGNTRCTFGGLPAGRSYQCLLLLDVQRIRTHLVRLYQHHTCQVDLLCQLHARAMLQLVKVHRQMIVLSTMI